MKSLDFKLVMIAAVLCTAIILPAFLNAECDMMAMLAKQGNQISNYNALADELFQFQKDRSCQAHQDDGYGVIYYKNNSNIFNYNWEDPFNSDNQAFYLWGEYNNCWYQCEWHQPDTFCHRWQDSNDPGELNYDWRDISGLCTLAEFTHNDIATLLMPIGFDFNFYGTEYNQFRISPNGWIGFGADTQGWENLSLPDPDAPRPAIFGFWDDLDPLQGGDVYYYSNSDSLVVWFDNVIHFPGNYNGTYDFEMIIYPSGNILFQYRSMDGDIDSATIGIQNAGGIDIDALQVSYNENYVQDELAVLFSTDIYPEPLDIAYNMVTQTINEAVIVLGHDRNRAGVSAGAAGQHPYRFIYTDPEPPYDITTYTFQHNGWHELKEPMYWYCYSYNSDWFDDYPLNWEVLGNNIYDRYTVCDTELLFHYIMAHVIEFNGDVIAGMISAFNKTEVYDSLGFVYNFQETFRDNWNPNRINSILSDGEALYIFRNANDPYPDYNLSYKEYDGLNEGFIGVKTDATIPGGTTVQQYSLVEIPREGEIVTYENILTDAKAYSFNPTSEPGWTWLSFDILNVEPQDNIASELLDPIKDFSLLDYALFKDHGPNTEPQRIEYLGEELWLNGDHPITSPYGYKFCTFNDCHLTIFGERCEATTTFELAGENEENWIGYFLLETQHVYDAFAGHLDNLTEIRAQHWAVKKGNGWPDVPYTISPGDMIIVKCERDIPEFSWNFEESREKYIVPESQDFTFEEEADYIPVFISLDPEDLPSEIGAFVDGECKGATVVQDTSAQICSYILENQGQNLTFEFSYGSRGQNKRIDEYGIYEPETSQTIKGSIQIDIRRDCYYVSFKGNQNVTPTTASIEITNYPNPFNPETKIEYSIPSESKIELSIYNIKGQKVRTLIKGTQQSGSYTIIWDGKDENGKPVGTGLYFYKLKTSDKELTKKMLLLK